MVSTQNMRSQLKDGLEAAKGIGQQALDTGSDMLHDFSETAQGTLKAGYEQAEDIGSMIADFVRERPLTTLVLAATVGCMFGYFYRRR